VAVGLGLAGFGWWGTATEAGWRAYHEVDAIIPLYAGFLGVVMVFLGTVLVVSTRRESRGVRGFDVIRSVRPDRDRRNP